MHPLNYFLKNMDLVYFFVGLSCVILYVVFLWRLKKLQAECPDTKDEHLVLLEYRTLNEEIRRRGDMLAIHGSIFVVISLLLVGESVSKPQPEKVGILFVALFIYVMWLFAMTYSTRKLDDIAFARLHGIEKQLGFKAHIYMREKTCDFRSKFWLEARRFVWGFVLIVLILGSFYLLRI